MRKSLIGLLAAALLAGAALVPVALGTAPAKAKVKVKAAAKPVVLDGQTLFRSNCGGCHTLADAKTHGRVGPLLTGDDLDVPSVLYMIENGDGVMPSFIDTLDAKQIKTLAAWVSKATND